MTGKATILIIEDNLDILRANATELRMENYCVLEADTLEAGRALTEREAPDLILLDIILPDGSGLDYCREVFGQNSPRILFLSAMDTSEDVIAGLRAGGDDYMTKPYLMQELLARVEAILRRPLARQGDNDPRLMTRGPLILDILASQAFLFGEDMFLSHKEFALLLLLVQHEGEALPKETIYQRVWGQPMAEDANAVRMVVSRLRKKLEGTGYSIEAVRNAGYRFGENLEPLVEKT